MEWLSICWAITVSSSYVCCFFSGQIEFNMCRGSKAPFSSFGTHLWYALTKESTSDESDEEARLWWVSGKDVSQKMTTAMATMMTMTMKCCQWWWQRRRWCKSMAHWVFFTHYGKRYLVLGVYVEWAVWSFVHYEPFSCSASVGTHSKLAPTLSMWSIPLASVGLCILRLDSQQVSYTLALRYCDTSPQSWQTRRCADIVQANLHSAILVQNCGPLVVSASLATHSEANLSLAAWRCPGYRYGFCFIPWIGILAEEGCAPRWCAISFHWRAICILPASHFVGLGCFAAYPRIA